MNRAPLSKEPVNLFILLKMAYTDSLGANVLNRHLSRLLKQLF